MATIIPVATTTPGTARDSATFAYNGRHDRSIEVDILCPTWDTADPSIEVVVRVQESFDSGDTWEDFAILDTTAGRRGRTGNMPTMTCQVVDGLGARIARAELTVQGGDLAVGVNATIV
jgi:hypothetical protein